jgi:TetR/AcrR family transcriptional repressor of the ameABC operon
MTNRRPTREETRLRILQKAGELFRQYGFGKTTVADIAGELGMSTANIYKFFPSRNALVEATAERNVATIKRDVMRLVGDESPVMARIEACILSVYRFHKELLQNERQIFKLIASAIEERWSCIEEFDAFMRETLEQLIAEGIKRREFRPADPRETAGALLDCLSIALHPHIRNAVVHDGSEERVRAQLRLLAKALA